MTGDAGMADAIQAAVDTWDGEARLYVKDFCAVEDSDSPSGVLGRGYDVSVFTIDGTRKRILVDVPRIEANRICALIREALVTWPGFVS